MPDKCFMILASYAVFSFNCILTGLHEISSLKSEKSSVLVQDLGELAFKPDEK